MITSIYAAYRGDRYVGEGTLSELAELLGVKRKTLLWARYPAAKKRVEKTEANRQLVRDFLVDVMQGRHPEKTPEYFDGDAYIQHNTGIADGLSGLGAALAALAEQGIQMIYTTVHQVLAQGNFVLAVSEGTFGGAPTSYYDLWRVENGRIAEHWDVMETIAAKETWQNQNGKF